MVACARREAGDPSQVDCEQRQVERHRLAELIAAYEAEQGRLSQSEVDEARALLRGDSPELSGSLSSTAPRMARIPRPASVAPISGIRAEWRGSSRAW